MEKNKKAPIISPKLASVCAGTAAGLFYGLLLRILSGHAPVDGLVTVMSIGFMLVGPLVIGFISIRSMKHSDISVAEAFFWPFVPILFGCLATYAMDIEGVICIVMYLPAGLILSGVGGLIARSQMKGSRSTVLAVMLLPFATHLVEGKVSFEEQSHTVKNSVEIHGSASAVWNEIKSVKTITSKELASSWVHRMGFPRPLDAEIDAERIGGVRTARFERGLVFVETVDQWKPNELLSFKIKIDPKDIPPTALDEHVTIGGPFFDVLHGTYHIEQRPDGTVTLNLESNFRLSTHFNFYAGVWTDLIMHQIQSDILKVIKLRAEKSTQQASAG